MKKNQALLNNVADWMRDTDLSEVSYRRGNESLQLCLDQGAPALPSFPASTLVPVSSPEVGIFRASTPGKAFNAEEGASVKKGDILGLIETAGSKLKLKAPESGRLSTVLAEDGKAVEYGQPLFFIKP